MYRSTRHILLVLVIEGPKRNVHLLKLLSIVDRFLKQNRLFLSISVERSWSNILSIKPMSLSQSSSVYDIKSLYAKRSSLNKSVFRKFEIHMKSSENNFLETTVCRQYSSAVRQHIGKTENYESLT